MSKNLPTPQGARRAPEWPYLGLEALVTHRNLSMRGLLSCTSTTLATWTRTRLSCAGNLVLTKATYRRDDATPANQTIHCARSVHHTPVSVGQRPRLRRQHGCAAGPSRRVHRPYLPRPPFNSNQHYVASFGDKGKVEKQLKDVWRWTVETELIYQRLPHGSMLNAIDAIRLVCGKNSDMAAYAVFMGRRIDEMHRTLKPTGSLYLHCDPTANWCLRILL